MDWNFITNHLFCGYIPMMVAMVLYFIILQLVGKKQTGKVLLANLRS